MESLLDINFNEVSRFLAILSNLKRFLEMLLIAWTAALQRIRIKNYYRQRDSRPDLSLPVHSIFFFLPNFISSFKVRSFHKLQSNICRISNQVQVTRFQILFEDTVWQNQGKRMESITSPLKYCYKHVQTTTIVALFVQSAVELFAYTIHIVKWELSYHLSSIKVTPGNPCGCFPLDTRGITQTCIYFIIRNKTCNMYW